MPLAVVQSPSSLFEPRAVVVLWNLIFLVSSIATVMFYRRRVAEADGVRTAIMFSAIAGLPTGLFLIEVDVRFLTQGSLEPSVSAVLVLLWALVGPVLMLVSWMHWAPYRKPWPDQFLRMSHLVLWGWASYLAAVAVSMA